jgi:hypothetical protein
MNKYINKKSSMEKSLDVNIKDDVEIKDDIDIKPKVHLLNLNEKYVYESSSISSTSSD